MISITTISAGDQTQNSWIRSLAPTYHLALILVTLREKVKVQGYQDSTYVNLLKALSFHFQRQVFHVSPCDNFLQPLKPRITELPLWQNLKLRVWNFKTPWGQARCKSQACRRRCCICLLLTMLRKILKLEASNLPVPLTQTYTLVACC